MPRGRGKGGNKRKRGKNMNFGEKRELLFKEDEQEYGQVLRLLGGGRVETNCFDGMKRMCTIRGKMRNRVWINAGDIVLIALREFGDDKADLFHKYYPEEAFELQEMGEIPDHIAINEGAPDEEGMGDEDDDDEDELANIGEDQRDEDGEEKKKLDDKDIDDI